MKISIQMLADIAGATKSFTFEEVDPILVMWLASRSVARIDETGISGGRARAQLDRVRKRHGMGPLPTTFESGGGRDRITYRSLRPWKLANGAGAESIRPNTAASRLYSGHPTDSKESRKAAGLRVVAAAAHDRVSGSRELSLK